MMRGESARSDFDCRMTRIWLGRCWVWVVAVVGLLGAAPAWADAQIVAQVNGTPITETDIEAANPSASHNPAERQQILQQLVAQTILAQQAQREGLAKDLAIEARERAACANVRRQILASAGAQHYLAKHPVTERAINAYYDRLKAESPKTQYRLREIVVTDDARAHQILDALRQGKSFSNLAATSSMGPNAALGGELGWLTEKQIPATLLKVVEHLQTGDVAGPVVVPEGLAIVQILGKRPVSPPLLEQVRAQIENQLREIAINAYLAELRKHAKISGEISAQ